MDAARFDRLAKKLATGRSRRGMLRGLAGLVLGGALVSAGQEEAGAARCIPPGGKCRRFTQCCSGKCKKRRDNPEGKCAKCPEGFYYCKKENRCISETTCCTDENCGGQKCCDGECRNDECCNDDDCSPDGDQKCCFGECEVAECCSDDDCGDGEECGTSGECCALDDDECLDPV